MLPNMEVSLESPWSQSLVVVVNHRFPKQPPAARHAFHCIALHCTALPAEDNIAVATKMLFCLFVCLSTMSGLACLGSLFSLPSAGQTAIRSESDPNGLKCAGGLRGKRPPFAHSPPISAVQHFLLPPGHDIAMIHSCPGEGP